MKKAIWIIIVILVLIIVAALVITGDDSSVSMEEDVSMEEGTSMDQQQEGTTPDIGLAVSVEDGEYEIDTASSTITWTGRKTLVDASHTGTVSVSGGSVAVAGGNITGGEFTMDMTSIATDGSGVLEHILSDDFFSVETHPTSTFVLTSVDNNVATGDLTIKGITNSISFPVVVSTEDSTIVATADFQIDRSKWDVRFGSVSFFSDLGDKAIDNNIDISLNLRTK